MQNCNEADDLIFPSTVFHSKVCDEWDIPSRPVLGRRKLTWVALPHDDMNWFPSLPRPPRRLHVKAVEGACIPPGYRVMHFAHSRAAVCVSVDF